MNRKNIWKSNKNTYRFIANIGNGGNGAVHKVKDSFGKLYALKELHITKSTQGNKALSRFRAEITVLSKLKNQPGIVQLLDSYYPNDLMKRSSGGEPFYIMPLGVSLLEFVKGKPDNEIFEIFIKICEGLELLHNIDITHRDIKPANMLVIDNKPVLSDFGLANFPQKENISSPNEPIGAKWTIAPEMQRISNQSEYKRADIYSLAKSLWILITGEEKGFEGQYIGNSNIGLSNFVDLKVNTTIIGGVWYYHSLVLLDKLLADSTSNNPQERPTIHQFIRKLKYWIYSNEHYEERNPYEWKDALQRIFPVAIPSHTKWENIDTIYQVLKILTQYDNLTHMFLHTTGGLDMIKVEYAKEQGCLILIDEIILKPSILSFEMIGDLNWSYFRLEALKIDPLSNPTKDNYEELYLNSEGYYTSNREEAVKVADRCLNGCFIIIFKTSPLNDTESVYDGYDGVHNTLSASEFRDYLSKIKLTL